MDNEIKERLDGYLELLEEISKKTGDSNTALALLHEISKDRRIVQMKEEQRIKNVPATDKQKTFMDDLGIKYPKNVSKQEASALIEEELGKAE